MTRYVYISISGDNKISVFTMHQDSGKLTHQEDVALHDGPGPMALHPSRPVLYAALRSAKEILSLCIDPSTGGLSQAASVKVQEGPAMISTDRTGRYLFGAYYGGGAASVNPIDEDGVAGDPQVQWVDTTERGHYIEADDSNKFVFVPHVMPGNAIYQFHFDENTGKLTPNEPHVQAPEGEGPRHFCFHPNQKFLYTSNENGNTVTAYHFDNTKGTLSPFQTVSALPPEGYEPGEEINSCAQIRITPNGKYLYAPNRGHNTVACFRVDESGGLATIGYTPTERHVRGTAMDPEGRFFFTTGTFSGRMASYTISQQTGALEPLEILEVGAAPMWVVIRTVD